MTSDKEIKTQNQNQDDAREAYPEQELTHTILQAAFTVHNTLGAGFLEKVYENALAIELRRCGLNIEQQKPLQVLYV